MVWALAGNSRLVPRSLTGPAVTSPIASVGPDRPIVLTRMTFAELLKLARRGAGMTQEELASAARVSARSISDLERGVYPTARKETARRLAEALALDASARATFEAAARGDNVIGGSSLAALPNRGVAEATKALPRDIAAFTGRCAELETIMNSAAQNSGVAIQVIDGMAGVGKTTFAVRAAHQLAPDFPDGQIFLALHAHTPGQTTASPEDALASLLLTIGISRQQIPPGLEPRAAAWRSHTAGKRLLILLDDVSGHDQVRSLFPGTGKHLVLITSRRRLTALEDCGTISLETLPDPEAIELFIRLCGRPELGTQNTAVAELVRFCGGLPLAVGLLARQLYHHRIWTAEDLSRDLRDARNRLDLIHAENLSVAAALDLSYQDLEPDEQVFFRLLGQQPGTDIDPYAAAALAHTDVPTARRRLLSLYDHHLVTEPAHDRFRLHDLVRQHARMLTSEPTAKAEAARGLLRLLDYYLHVARSASALLTRRPASHITEATGDPPAFAPQLRTRTDAVRWLTAERLSLQACAEWAAVNGQLNYVIATSAAMHDFLHSSGHWDQAVSLHTAAVAAAHAADSRLAEADALTNLGDIQHMVMDMPSAEENLARAIELYRETRNRRGEANAILLLGIIQRLTDYRRATTSLTVALSLYQEDGDRLGQANVLQSLASPRRSRKAPMPRRRR
jgi:transcriptional regulator with XRE-family HTH domain/tetratricopeptide (TPR) repeat protein